MARISYMTIIVSTFFLSFHISPVWSQDEEMGELLQGTFEDLSVIDKAVLEKILEAHKKWIETNKEDGEQADLSGAALGRVRLISKNLTEAKLNETDLSEAYLNKVELRKTEMARANLRFANIVRSDLTEANLTEAKLIKAVFKETILSKADLSGADLTGADLSSADLSGVKLEKAVLLGANLSKSNLRGANLSGALLSKVDLTLADLRNADFSLVDLTESDLRWATSLPELRESFKKAGSRDNVRFITYTIKLAERQKLSGGNFLKKVESLFYLTFFEWTCKYGMRPGRPLLILICLIPLFTLSYLFALRKKRMKTGIWLILPDDRIFRLNKEVEPYKLTGIFPQGRFLLWFRKLPLIRKLPWVRILDWFCTSPWIRTISIWYRRIKIALYFSLLSAVRVGWRDFNLGNLLMFMQRKEYLLRSTGWARFFSGLQSLISVYLFALWVLTYFGRPFEAF